MEKFVLERKGEEFTQLLRFFEQLVVDGIAESTHDC